MVGKALEAAEQQEKIKRRRKPRPGKIVVKAPVEHASVTCRGGRVRSGKCVCGRSEIRKTIGRNAYVCADRGPPIEIATPSSPAGDKVTGTPPKTLRPAISPAPDTGPPSPAAGDGDREFAPDQVVVVFATSTPESVDEAVARDFRLEVRDRFESALIGARVVLYGILDGRSAETVLAAMRPDGRFQEPQANYFYRYQADSSSVLSGDELQYAHAKVELPSAHTLARGRGALIAVIDSAVDDRHPNLKSAITEIYDATGGASSEPDGHGTAIAGIIKATGTVRGVAPGAKLLSVTAFKPRPGGQPAVTTSFILLRALDWAIAQNARVLNLSFAGPNDPLFARAIKAAQGRHAIIVAAAGNNGRGAPPAYPAAYDEVIAVTATDAADQLYANANRGGYIALAAPGVDVLVLDANGGHQFQSGTSFAAAHVSGIIALMLENNPRLSAEEARRALTAAAHDLGAPGKDDEFGAGRVNAHGALRTLEQTTAIAP